MNKNSEVIFYDGISAKPYLAKIFPIDFQCIVIRYGKNLEKEQRYTYDDMVLIGALGKLKPVIELKDDARIEFQSELPDWFNLGKQKKIYRYIWKFERSPSLIIFSFFFVIIFIIAVLKWGIPYASYVVAYQLPETTLNKIGEDVEDIITKQMTAKSTLPRTRQQQIEEKYQSIVAEGRPAKLVFREGSNLGANAVALPNNTIIITDELVELAQNDEEILGVLAHEQGHLIERHSLQQALTSLGMSIIYIAITGDSSDLFSSLPATIAGSHYSRKFESSADVYALNLMDRRNIEVSNFGNILQRLSDQVQEDKVIEESNTDETKESIFSQILDVFSSHPDTKARIQMVKDFEKQQQKK